MRKVFDFLTDVSTNYDRRTSITYDAGLYSKDPATDSIYPVTATYSLPLFDVWRSLSMFEFHEFLTSFDNNLFESLMGGNFRNTALFYMPGRFPETTYLHKYTPGHVTWDVTGSFGGTFDNPRNASGVSFIEDSLVMDIAEKKDC